VTEQDDEQQFAGLSSPGLRLPYQHGLSGTGIAHRARSSGLSLIVSMLRQPEIGRLSLGLGPGLPDAASDLVVFHRTSLQLMSFVVASSTR
jgi:hypothetical protein